MSAHHGGHGMTGMKIRLLRRFHFILSGLLFAVWTHHTAAAQTEQRDPWLWPFSRVSIWNQPIGSEAVYTPAHLQAAKHVGVDTQFLVQSTESSPKQPVFNSPTWGPGRASGTTPLGFSIRIPDDWVIPDAGKRNPYGLTPNANFAIRLPDSDTVLQGSKICRPEPGGPVYLPDWMRYPNNRKTVSLFGDGLAGGGQGASGMSALGGTLRRGELTGDSPIRHAIKLNPFGKRYCYYSEEVPGYRWPAKGADSYAAKVYGGTNPKLVMGSLLAIPPEVSVDDLKLQTTPGRKLFFTLQNYGAYFTEDTAWDAWDLIVEQGAETEFAEHYGFSLKSETWRNELNKLVQALHIVDNNSPHRIGGGGTPRQPLAPVFKVAPQTSQR